MSSAPRRRCRVATRLLASAIAGMLSLSAAERLHAQPGGVGPPAPLPAPFAATVGEDCADESLAGRPADAVALLGGRWILAPEVDDRITGELLSLDCQLAEARVRQLDQMIHATLLRAEAERRGTTDVELLRAEIAARMREPTEAELRAAYEAVPVRGRRPFETLRPTLRRHLLEAQRGGAAAEFAEQLRGTAGVDSVEPHELLDPLEGDGERILARVGEKTIRWRDLEAEFAHVVAEHARQCYELRLEGLDVVVNSILLAEEARRRDIDTRTLLEREIASSIPEVSDLQARTYWDRHREAFDVDVRTPEGLEQVRRAISDEFRANAELGFARRLRDGVTLRLLLPPPPEMQWVLLEQGQPSLGSPDAAVVVQVFIDLECASCAWLHDHIVELLGRSGDRVRFVLRDFPLEHHPNAYRGAVACEAAHAQGKSWEYSGLLYARPGERSDEALLAAAASAGLDLDRFRADCTGERARQAVDSDIREGMRIGIDSTPAVYVDGVHVELTDGEAIDRAIERRLAELAAGGPADGRMRRER